MQCGSNAVRPQEESIVVELEEQIQEQIQKQIEEPVLPPIEEPVVLVSEEASFFGSRCNCAEHVLSLVDVMLLPCDVIEHVLDCVFISIQRRLGVHDRRMGTSGVNSN